MKRLWFILIFFPGIALAFPDTVRHGYVNCSSCHVSPSGGGLLNAYGRSVSREVLSTWGRPGEEKPFHGLLGTEDQKLRHFLLGGDARYITRRQTTASSKIDEGFWMQAQLKIAVSLGDMTQATETPALQRLKFLSTIGKFENPRKSQDVSWVSPEHFVLYSPQELIHFRIGRFEPVFGLRLPDHNLWIKTDLGLVPWIERDAAEFIFEGENQFLSVAGFQSISSVNFNSQMTGYTVNLNQIIYETSRVGFSAMNAEGQGTRLRIASLHGTLSWTEKFYSMFDISRVWSSDSEKDIAFARIGREWIKGFTPFVQLQGRFDRTAPTNDQRRTGIGLLWLPRPHFELMLQFENTTSRSGTTHENFMMFHYYL